MTGRKDELQNLVELAQDRSLESRRRLTDKISDLHGQGGGALTDRERDLMTEILKRLIKDFEVPIRRALAERFAKDPGAPRDLVLALANDQILVAEPLLLGSPLFQERELIEIVRNRSRQHQLAVARRHDLSEPVADALVQSDDVDVITTLLENKDARISQATMAYLVEEAKRIDSFQEPLVKRGDLRPELARSLYWWVGANLRQQILRSFPISRTQLDNEIEPAIRAIVEGHVWEPGPGGRQTAARRLAKNLAGEGAIAPALLLKVLRRGQMPLFEALFAEFAGLGSPRIERVVYDESGQNLAIVCRALGMTKQIFATIYLLTRGSGAVTRAQALGRATQLFDRIARDKAMEVVAYWRRDSDYLEAIEQLAEVQRRGEQV